MTDRIEEIRRRAPDTIRLAREQWHKADAGPLPLVPVHWAEYYALDVPCLLERIKQLEAENERLRARVNRMLAAGMGKDWGDGFEDLGGYE